MVAAREPRSMSVNYDDIIRAIDWNRVLLQAVGLHRKMHIEKKHHGNTCGECIKSVLLRKEE